MGGEGLDDGGDDARRREHSVGLVGRKETVEDLGLKKHGAHTMVKVATLTATYTYPAMKVRSPFFSSSPL